MAEIGMILIVWAQAKIMICWWHLKQALNARISSAKLSMTPYSVKHANDAHDCFSFIDPSSCPVGKADKNKFEGGQLDDDGPEAESANTPPPTQAN